MPVSSPKSHSPSLLKSKRYLFYWISSLFSNIGTWMQQVAQPWVVLSLSHSSLWVGLDSFAMNAPVWLFTLWGGVLADRQDRRKLILVCQGIQWVCILVLMSLLILGWLKVWMIVLISFLVGLTDALSMPAFQSIIPSLVEPKEIPKAVALNSVQFNLSRVLGPAVAGLLIARYGATICFGANALSFVPFFLSVYWIYPRGAFKKPKSAKKSEPHSQMHQYKTLVLNPKIRTSLFTIGVTTIFCAPLITFCPVLIKEIFHASVSGFGGAMAAFGLGGLLGAGFVALPLPKFCKRDQFALAVAILMSLILAGIALNRSPVILVPLLVLAGFTLTISMVSANTFLQQAATDLTRGRMASVFQLAMHGGLSVGALLTGLSVEYFGISKALLFNGILATLLLGTLALWQIEPKHLGAQKTRTST